MATVRRPPERSLLRSIFGGKRDSKEDGTRERIVDGARKQAEAFGLRRFTVEDVARLLGLSRVTIYRHFPKKEQLVEAMLMGELRRFLADVEAKLAAYDTLDAWLVEGVSSAIVALRQHALLDRVLKTEPEVLLPLLTRDAGPVLAVAREFIARYPRKEVAAGRAKLDEADIEVTSEILARLVLSFVLTPSSVAKIDTLPEARKFTERYLAPVLRAMVKPERRPSTPPARNKRRAS